MRLTITDLNVPIRLDADGVARIAETRVTLDTVIGGFHEGAAPETLIRQYPTLRLPDVYAVFAYYLRNRDDVNAYLKEQELLGEEMQRQWEARHPREGVKDRLLSRKSDLEARDASIPRG